MILVTILEKSKLAAFVEQERKRLGVSQNELARRAEISQGFLSEVLAGKKSPTVRFFKKIAPILGVTPDYLFSLSLEDELNN